MSSIIVELRDAKGARGQSDGLLSLQFLITWGGLWGFFVGQNLDKTWRWLPGWFQIYFGSTNDMNCLESTFYEKFHEQSKFSYSFASSVSLGFQLHYMTCFSF